jgi:ubiquinone/menaquinone biosynthesis C-methylase UbiE
MSGKSIPYDRIASTYDRRYAVNRLEGVASALQALAHDLEAGRVLEVGCGTGRWLGDLRSGARQLYGLDYSAHMLLQARARGKQFHLLHGRGGQLPLSGGSFDMVYCVNAIHHFDDQRAFISEARRLLRPGGALAVVGMDPHGPWVHWYVYRYFEGALEAELGRFPSWGTVVDWMVADGFRAVEWRPVERILARRTGRGVLSDPFLQRGSSSTLALLTDEVYAAGLRRIESALADAEAAGEEIAFITDIRLAMLVGRV